MAALSTLWSKNLPAWFDDLDPVLFFFPLGIAVAELFHTGFLHNPACPRHVRFRWPILFTGGISKSACRGRSVGTSVCNQWSTIRMPLKTWHSLCRWRKQTLLGLINLPKSKLVLKWGSEPRGFGTQRSMLPPKRRSCYGTCQVWGLLCEAIQTAKSKFQWVFQVFLCCCCSGLSEKHWRKGPCLGVLLGAAGHHWWA